jgi:FAD dependent oxidoreductase TIGR03364
MTSWPAQDDSERADLIVVGAGIVGLAHAVEAVARSARVTVVDRSSRAVGASVRNFGHGCVTAQAGVALSYATASRLEWLRLAKAAGFWLRDAGTVVVAATDDEYAVLSDLAAERGDDVVLLDQDGVRAKAPVGGPIVGGAWLPLDIRVDPREAPAAIAAWLADQGVTFHWSTSVLGIDGDEVRTSRGVLKADRLVVAIGHDVDRLFPEIAAEAGIQRCSLHMLALRQPSAAVIDSAVLTGYSMLRYDGFAVSPALARVRERLTTVDPEGTAAGLNLMFTQRPDGDIVLGDTHTYGQTVSPFRDETYDDLLLRHAHRLLDTADLRIRERWRGVYASAPQPFLVAMPAPNLAIASVTAGIGMTTAFGFAGDVLDRLL